MNLIVMISRISVVCYQLHWTILLPKLVIFFIDLGNELIFFVLVNPRSFLKKSDQEIN